MRNYIARIANSKILEKSLPIKGYVLRERKKIKKNPVEISYTGHTMNLIPGIA